MRKPTIPAVLATCAGMLIVLAPPEAVAQHHHANGKIAFAVTLPDNGTDTYTIDPDGTGLSRVDIPLENEDFGRAVWSHDGLHLLYSNIPYTDPTSGEFVGFLPAIS